jgi:hypothetical protein
MRRLTSAENCENYFFIFQHEKHEGLRINRNVRPRQENI